MVHVLYAPQVTKEVNNAQSTAEAGQLGRRLEESVRKYEADIRSLKQQLSRDEQKRQQEKQDTDTMLFLLASQDSELGAYKTRLHGWAGQLTRALQCVGDMHSELVCTPPFDGAGRVPHTASLHSYPQRSTSYCDCSGWRFVWHCLAQQNLCNIVRPLPISSADTHTHHTHTCAHASYLIVTFAGGEGGFQEWPAHLCVCRCHCLFHRCGVYFICRPMHTVNAVVMSRRCQSSESRAMDGILWSSTASLARFWRI